ncbi:MAG: hypothetical protein JXA68_09920 [Ignavibacteriales bacterium]|nr:hypothetical protein [Ignavibacteriales bacterium]
MRKYLFPLIFVAIALLMSQCKFSCSVGGSDSVTFCTNVDDDLKCQNENDEFPIGEVWVRLETEDKFEVNQIVVSIYAVDGTKEELKFRDTGNVNPEWSIWAVPLTFPEVGKYKVTFTKPDGKELGVGEITIK